MIKLFAIWVCGLLTAVPAATYHLLFHAERSEYAALIVFVGFWVFGFWGLVGSATAIIKTRRVYRALEHVRSPEQLKEFVQRVVALNQIGRGRREVRGPLQRLAFSAGDV